MRYLYQFAVLFLFINTQLNQLFAQNGHRIEIAIKGLNDTTVILGHYRASQSLYSDDTTYIDKHGNGVFEGKEKLHQGLYFLYLPGGRLFDFIMGEDQKFSLSTDTADFFNKLEAKGSADNEIYIDYIREMNRMNSEMKKYTSELADTLNEKNTEKIKEKIDILIKERSMLVRKMVRENPDLMVSAFLKGTLETDIPDSLKQDQAATYIYAKSHFFNDFDISDPRLLYTPLYDPKIRNYLDKMVLQIPDSLIKEIDIILDKVLGDSSLFSHVVTNLFSKYHKSEIMGMDALVVHIAEKYLLPKSWWLSEKSYKEIEDWVRITKPVLIGKKAPEFSLMDIPAEHFKLAANDTALKRYPHAGRKYSIYDLKADFIVLYFWSPSCSHCKKEVPLMYNVYQNEIKGKNIEVIAINTLSSEDGKEKWVDFVNKHQLYDWKNAWYPYDFKFKEDYDLRTTPQVYVLNKDKEIIGKKISGEQVPGLIEAYIKIHAEEMTDE